MLAVCVCPCARSDNICGRAQGIAAGLQAYRAYEGLLAGKCIEKSKDDPEQAYVREQFELYMEPAMKTPAMDQKVGTRQACACGQIAVQ